MSQYKPTLCSSMPGGSCEVDGGDVAAFSGPGESPPPPPTPSQPPPPSFIQCADPEFVSWSLTLQADNWPLEIGWTLTKTFELVDSFLVEVPEAEAVVAEVNFGDLMEPGGSWSWRRCLGPGVYTLRIWTRGETARAASSATGRGALRWMGKSRRQGTVITGMACRLSCEPTSTARPRRRSLLLRPPHLRHPSPRLLSNDHRLHNHRFHSHRRLRGEEGSSSSRIAIGISLRKNRFRRQH